MELLKNGDMILNPDGKVTHACGWSGKDWKQIDEHLVEINFNNVHHIMCLDPTKNYLFLISPIRFPPTLAIRQPVPFPMNPSLK
eukprot:CAMPEP_0170541800 /NCGR_PEP_ID=MMETSP0211-20121228/1429_1 /TAXON_ID=311385 /ORGANISM="Pseudokeronopsis sp., Strain OXSARD2" /LENGTH=83 /DNA_ID=CAMNT_0010844661 /DNA_START=134 /DNA_END=384 /DNA_ORIENTATION=-